MENFRSEAIRYDWIHTRVYKIRENFDIFKVFKMDSMKMDEKKRFGSWIFETSEPIQRRLNGPLENGKMIENTSEQQQDNETIRLKADWLGKSRRVNHLQSTRDRQWNQRWHWLQNGKRRRSWTTIIWSTPNFWFDTGYLNPLQCWTMVTDLWKSFAKDCLNGNGSSQCCGSSRQAQGQTVSQQQKQLQQYFPLLYLLSLPLQSIW